MTGESKIAYQGSRFSVDVVERTNPDGITRSCEVIRHPGSVALLPLLDDGRICLIRNHRVTVDEALIEVPAGTREPNEAPMATAHCGLAMSLRRGPTRVWKKTSVPLPSQTSWLSTRMLMKKRFIWSPKRSMKTFPS